MSLSRATGVDDELRALWERALGELRATRGGQALLVESLPASGDPLGDLVTAGQVFVEHRDDVVVGVAVVRDAVIVGVYVTPAWRGQGVARSIATELFALSDPPLDALALPGDRATKSLYESLGLKARLLTMRAE